MSKTILFEDDPKRLDAFLTDSEHDFSREFIKKLIKAGKVMVNGKIRKPAHILTFGDKIILDMPRLKDTANILKDITIYEDDEIIAINKPSGLKMHPNDANWEETPQAALLGDETVVSMILKSQPKVLDSGVSRMGLVHRLDRDTSGLVIIAKTSEVQEALSMQFKERLIDKKYLGVTDLVSEDSQGRIEAPIGRLKGDKKNKVWKYGRYALTEFKVIENGKKYSLLEVYPKTGRTNQIRIHLAYIDYPVAGDKLYKGSPAAARLMLHSNAITFKLPSKKRRKTLKCAPPKDFMDEWKKLKKSDVRLKNE
ncbi:MAG: RluA family pseudouridine synthase [Elusimicrobiota bacterium]|nr:RluA family pseudouridine synthase [Elusimicrobiota bacterium]